MPDPTNPGAVVPADQTVATAAPAAGAPTAIMQVANGLGNGWAKIITNMTAVGAIMLFAYLMLTQILDSAKGAQDLLREGQKEQGDRLGTMVEELRDVKRANREQTKAVKEQTEAVNKGIEANGKVMKESADSLRQIANEIGKAMPKPSPPNKPGAMP